MAISVDDREHALLVWEKTVNRQFTILSDPGARVIRTYGLVHPGAGMEGGDIALDTTALVDTDGHERWRHVSETLPDLPAAEEILKRIREMAAPGQAPVGHSGMPGISRTYVGCSRPRIIFGQPEILAYLKG